MFANKPKRLFINPIRSVVISLETTITFGLADIRILRKRLMSGNGRIVLQANSPAIAPQIGRIVAMSVPLAVIAEETVKALPKRIAFRAGKAQPPFPKGARRVSLNAKHLRQRSFTLRKRSLPFRADFAVIAHSGVAGMFSRHQHAPRRRAHGATRITLGKTHPLRRQPVNPRRLNLALPVASQLRITEIIR